ncbi:hypothetical protein RZS08_54390, partial [Arthrospira platensis SPKY1]|nr:hypothetical protein [Arthrospira platensis SPKY1]
ALELVGGPGLACDPVARDPRSPAGAFRPGRLLEHLAQGARAFRRKHPAQSLRRTIEPGQGQRQQFAVPGEYSICPGHMHEGAGQTIAVGHRRLFDRAPASRWAQSTACLAREAETQRSTDTQRIEHAP